MSPKTSSFTLLLSVALMFGSFGVLCNAGDFNAPKPYPLRGSVAGFANGDFNKDGKLDVAVVFEMIDDGTLSILLANGDGSFRLSASYPTFKTYGIVTGDFNGDGKLDLVTGGYSPKVLLGKGDGTFEQRFTNSDFQPSVAGDFNGDGYADLVGQSAGGGGIRISFSNGDGTFQQPVPLVISSGALTIGWVGPAGDFNGDGKLDLVVVSDDGGGEINVILGNGNGSFSPTYEYILNSFPSQIALADIDADGRPDLVVTSFYGNSINVFLGDGHGTFQNPVKYLISGPGAIAVADINRDGKIDLIVNGSDGMSVLPNKGNGTFGPADNYGIYASDLAAGDFTGDGKKEVVVILNGGGVAVLPVTSDGTLQAPLSFVAGSKPTSAAVADVNLDGNPDLVVTTENGVSVLLGNGHGRFGTPVNYPSGTKTYLVKVSDFNADAKPDLAVASQDGISVLLGNGNGTFRAAATYVSGSSSLAIGDFNRDGKLDLAASFAGGISVLLGNGDGSFGMPLSSGAGAGRGAIAIGDFNRDGKLDLAVMNSDNHGIGVLLGNGNGTFMTAVDYPTGTSPISIAVGDFTGDGSLDLAVGNRDCCSKTLTILSGNGDGTFGPLAYPWPTDVESVTNVVAADVNGDSKADLIAAGICDDFPCSFGSSDFGNIGVLLGKGNGTFQQSVYSLGTYPIALAGGDVNNDSAPDLIVVNGSGRSGFAPGNGVTVLLNLGGTFLTLTSSSNPSIYGQSVTFTAKVEASITGVNQQIPTGSVTFRDGSTVLGTVALSAGTAKLASSTIGTGSHSIQAYYLGNAKFNPNTSTVLTQTVTQPEDVTLNPTSLDFGSIEVGTTSPLQGVTLRNNGATTLNISATGFTGDFFLSSKNCTNSLAPSTSCLYVIRFKPIAVGLRTGTFSVSHNGGSSPSTVSLRGTGIKKGDIIQTASFVPMTPCRVADTRLPAGPFGGPAIAGQSSRDFVIPNSACGIPTTAIAYSLNVTVVPHGPLGFLTVWPSGQPQPLVSTLNSDGRVKANAAIIPAGSNQAISVFATNTTDLVLDVNGYFVATSDLSALAFYPLTPCRVVDTRLPNGPLGGPYLNGGQNRYLPLLSSSCGIPGTAQAFSLNFTAVPKGPLGFLTVWPSDHPRPFVSTLNSAGATTANAAIVPSASDGSIGVFATNNTDLVIDINGYFAPASSAPNPLSLHILAPCRVLDTRAKAGMFNGTLPVSVAGSCSVPGTAQALVLNATVVPPGFMGFLTLWPHGGTPPVVSTLNAWDGSVTSNMAIVPTNSGWIDAFAMNQTHLVLDISSYFAPPNTP